MFKVIRKIFFAVVLLRLFSMVGDVVHGPMKTFICIALLVCGIRMIFSKDADESDRDHH